MNAGMTKGERAELQQWRQQAAAKQRSDQAALQTREPSPYDALPRDAVDALFTCSSYERPNVLFVQMVKERNPRTRLMLFLAFWSCCDAPWPWRTVFAKELRAALSQVSLADVLSEAERDWFDLLPPFIEIYRGCEFGRERGLSWTTEIKIAEGFATGKRCVNRCPTLVTALIPKSHVFGVLLGRNESEIVVDPRRLRRF